MVFLAYSYPGGVSKEQKLNSSRYFVRKAKKHGSFGFFSSDPSTEVLYRKEIV